LTNIFPTSKTTELLALDETQGMFQGTTMFVDISGFTPLTQALMQQEAEGADTLSILLNQLFQPIVTQIYARGGFVTHFAGDAFTAVFEDNQTDRVAELAFSIRQSFQATPSVLTAFGSFKISVRIGLSYGIVEWGRVGFDKKTTYFKGTAIQRATLAQQAAQPNQIVADAWFFEKLTTENIDYQCIDNDFFIFENIKNQFSIDSEITKRNTVPLHLFQNWEGTVKNEFRDIVAVFMSFTHVSKHADIDILAHIVLDNVHDFGGYFKEIDFSEKYGVMVAFFGAPMAYENNASRALECVLAIQNALKTTVFSEKMTLRFGISAGKAYTGVVGGKERNQYAVVGDKVNTAARLMQNAVWGEIWTTPDIAQTKSFDFELAGNYRLKGISEPVQIYRLLKQKQAITPFFTGRMVGRDADMHALLAIVIDNIIENKRGCLAMIYGEAGVGKSRLLFEVGQYFKHKTIWATCPADQILKKSFNPFIYFLKNYFHQQLDTTVDANFIAFENRLETLVKSVEKEGNTEGVELHRTKSILAALIGLNYDNSLWEQLDAKGRYDNTIAALSNFFIVLSYQKPMIIELEDAHWLDDNTSHFLNDFIKKIGDKPIALLVTSRYSDEGEKPMLFDPKNLVDMHSRCVDIDLNIFTKEHLESLASYKLNGSIHSDLLETLWRTSNGNPFYAEQILDYFIENNIVQNVNNQYFVKDDFVKMSNSLSSVLTARIDRLSFILKETIKTAAVIGREFEVPILTEVLRSHDAYIAQNGNDSKVLQEQIQTAEKGQIWQAMNELRYIFRHTLLREAVYDMQLKTQLRERHATTAKAIEKVYAEKLEDCYIDLAFHYEQAGFRHETRFYLKNAAEHSRRLFQNQQALDLYERLLKNTDDPTDIIKIKIKRGEVLQLIGQWQAAEKQYQEALTDARDTENAELKGRTHNALGQLLMLKGNYKEAGFHLERAADNFEKVIDFQGIVRAYGNMGNLYFRQGVYDKAQDYFAKSISLAREQGIRNPAQVVANLGLTYMNQGKNTEGVRCQAEELAICAQNNDMAGMATLSVNLGIVWLDQGNLQEALLNLEDGLLYAQKLGNKQLISIALGCIGSIWLDKNNIEKAEQYLLQDLSITEELGDKQGISIASELLGRLYHTKAEYDQAMQYFDVSLSLCKSLNYQKGIAKTLMGMGNTYLQKTEFAYALKCFKEAYGTATTLNNSQIMVAALIEQCRIFIQQNDAENTENILNILKKEAAFTDNNKVRFQIDDFLISI
jgi:class 3 adenylate cyclase/tetratricopeptide (TPR) repeat protein